MILLLLILQQPAWAEVWGYVDAGGTAHFAVEQQDARYMLFSRSGEFDSTRDLPLLDPAAKPGAAVPAGTLGAARPVATSRLIQFLAASPAYHQVRQQIRDAASNQRLEVELLQALIATESGFDARAVSPKGAVGLMQLMPGTATRYGVAADGKNTVDKKLTDPRTNLGAGTRYLRYLLDLFPGQLDLALAAYNAGEGAVQRAGNRIPHFKETQDYVKTVLQLYALLKPSGDRVAGELTRRSAGNRIRMELGVNLPGDAPGFAADPLNTPLAAPTPLTPSTPLTSTNPATSAPAAAATLIE